MKREPEVSEKTVHSGVVRLEGRDALAVLHNISSAMLSDLGTGEVRTTLFCDFRGRLLHRAAVALAPDGAVWLVRADAPGAELLAFVDKHVFREDVRLADEDAAWRVREVSGASEIAAGRAESADGRPARLQIASDFALVVEAGAGSGALLESEVERIRAGRPRHGHEVSDAFTPFEVGLAHEVHLNKGCYPGQEALMRLITYGSVRRRLALIEGAGAAPTDVALRVGDRDAGRLTSVSADGGGWIALAVMRREGCEPGADVRLADGREIASVRAFAEQRPVGR
jgi:folate-binding protein YgfZ